MTQAEDQLASNQSTGTTATRARNALHEEMLSQPVTLLKVAADEQLARTIGRLAEDIRAEGRLLITGMGASLHAGSILASILRSNGYEAWTLPASEMLHHGPHRTRGPQLLISQSGASAEIVGLTRLTATGPRYCVTLNGSAELPQTELLVLPGGEEHAYAATRSFTSTIAAWLMLLAELKLVDFDPQAAANSMTDCLAEGFDSLTPSLDILEGASTLIVTARGLYLGVAAYAALITSELTGVPGFSMDAGQLRHGMIEVLSKDVAVVGLLFPSAVAHLTARLVSEAQEYGSPTLSIGASEQHDGGDSARLIRLNDGPLPQTLLSLIVRVQQLAYGLAERKGRDPGTETRGSKVTVLE